MTDPHYRKAECGCVEMWAPINDECDGTKSYSYHLYKCPPHWREHVLSRDAVVQRLRDFRDRVKEIEK